MYGQLIFDKDNAMEKGLSLKLTNYAGKIVY